MRAVSGSELGALLGGPSLGDPEFLPYVEPFDDCGRVATKALPRQLFERVSVVQPAAATMLFHSLDDDLRAHIRNVQSVARGRHVLDTAKATMIGEQLLHFARRAGLGDFDDPKLVLRVADLDGELGLGPRDLQPIQRKLIDLIDDLDANSDEAEYMRRLLSLLSEHLVQMFGSAKAMVESLQNCLEPYAAYVDMLRTRYQDEIRALVKEIDLRTTDQNDSWAAETGNMLCEWHNNFKLDGKLLLILSELQGYASAVVNVFRYKLLCVKKNLVFPENSDDEATLTTILRTWQELLIRVEELMNIVIAKPGSAADSPALVALQQCLAILGRKAGPSEARTAAFAAAKILLSGISLVKPVEKLYSDIQAEGKRCEGDLLRIGKEFQQVYQKYQVDINKQRLIVQQMSSALSLLQAESEAACAVPRLSAEHLARHSAVLTCMAEMQRDLAKEKLIFDQLAQSYGTLGALTASCSARLVQREFRTLDAEEQGAREKIYRQAFAAAKTFEVFRDEASLGLTQRLHQLLDECGNQLNQLCAQRDQLFTKITQHFPRLVEVSKARCTATVDTIGQYCSVHKAKLGYIRTKLSELPFAAAVRDFAETRADFVLALHLFQRLRGLADWAALTN